MSKAFLLHAPLSIPMLNWSLEPQQGLSNQMKEVWKQGKGMVPGPKAEQGNSENSSGNCIQLFKTLIANLYKRGHQSLCGNSKIISFFNTRQDHSSLPQTTQGLTPSAFGKQLLIRLNCTNLLCHCISPGGEGRGGLLN